MHIPTASQAVHTATATQLPPASNAAGPSTTPPPQRHGNADAGTALPAPPMHELAARFTEATNELQLLGLLRPAKKRKGSYAVRLVWNTSYIASGDADLGGD